MKIDVIMLLLTQRTLNRFTAQSNVTMPNVNVTNIPLIACNFSTEGAIDIN